MNGYDRLPNGIKWLHLLLYIAPAVVAGFLDHSWKSAATVFFGGSLLLAWAALSICTAILGRVFRTPDDELDERRFRPLYTTAFLFAGPMSGAIVAAFVLR